MCHLTIMNDKIINPKDWPVIQKLVLNKSSEAIGCQ